MAFQCCRVHFTHTIKHSFWDKSVFELYCIAKFIELFLLYIFFLYAMKVLSYGQLPREEYTIIDKLDVF